MASPAYKRNGLIVVTFDESGMTSTHQRAAGRRTAWVMTTHRIPTPTAGPLGSRRRPCRRCCAVAIHPARHCQQCRLQPLLAAEDRRANLRPRPARPRQAAAGARVRRGRVHPDLNQDAQHGQRRARRRTARRSAAGRECHPITNQPTAVFAGALAVRVIVNDPADGTAASTERPLCAC